MTLAHRVLQDDLIADASTIDTLDESVAVLPPEHSPAVLTVDPGGATVVRALGMPYRIGQEITVVQSGTGQITLVNETAFALDAAGSVFIIINATGEWCNLIAVDMDGVIRWRVISRSSQTTTVP